VTGFPQDICEARKSTVKNSNAARSSVPDNVSKLEHGEDVSKISNPILVMT